MPWNGDILSHEYSMGESEFDSSRELLRMECQTTARNLRAWFEYLVSQKKQVGKNVRSDLRRTDEIIIGSEDHEEDQSIRAFIRGQNRGMTNFAKLFDEALTVLESGNREAISKLYEQTKEAVFSPGRKMPPERFRWFKREDIVFWREELKKLDGKIKLWQADKP